MPKRPDINLIPTELRDQRKVEEVRKTFNFAGLGILIVLAVASLLVFGYRLKLDSDLENNEKLVTREQEKIRDLSGIEQDARRLKAKSEAADKIFQNQNRFSILLDNLAESTPQDVTVTNFSTIEAGKVGISGNAQSYNSLANFILTALDQNYGGKIFNGADLTSVSLDEVTGRARFAMVFYLKSNVLVKEE